MRRDPRARPVRTLAGVLRAAFLLIALAACSFGATLHAQGTRVETASGNVEGMLEDGIRSYRGIPLAAPPVGERRWQPPQPVEAWGQRKLRAHSFGPGRLRAGTP